MALRAGSLALAWASTFSESSMAFFESTISSFSRDVSLLIVTMLEKGWGRWEAHIYTLAGIYSRASAIVDPQSLLRCFSSLLAGQGGYSEKLSRIRANTPDIRPPSPLPEVRRRREGNSGNGPLVHRIQRSTSVPLVQYSPTWHVVGEDVGVLWPFPLITSPSHK